MWRPFVSILSLYSFAWSAGVGTNTPCLNTNDTLHAMAAVPTTDSAHHPIYHWLNLNPQEVEVTTYSGRRLPNTIYSSALKATDLKTGKLTAYKVQTSRSFEDALGMKVFHHLTHSEHPDWVPSVELSTSWVNGTRYGVMKREFIDGKNLHDVLTHPGTSDDEKKQLLKQLKDYQTELNLKTAPVAGLKGIYHTPGYESFKMEADGSEVLAIHLGVNQALEILPEADQKAFRTLYADQIESAEKYQLERKKDRLVVFYIKSNNLILDGQKKLRLIDPY